MPGGSIAQELCKVSPVIRTSGQIRAGRSFILTTLDDNLYKRRPLQYSSAIEIIDGDAPWPPRWFALHPTDTGTTIRPSMLLMMNASMDPSLHYLTMAQTNPGRYEPVVITCDQHLQPVDTFTAYRHIMDSHDFATDGHGGIIYFATHDTTIDLREAYGNPREALVPMVYQSIELADSSGRSTFSWNPFYQLGMGAMYLPYRYTRGIRSDQTRFDWSHGNSVHLDVDGDILYSFKHIGIGKISRIDGHVIWRIDRNKQRINAASDSLPIFLQHDLQAVRGKDGTTYYSVLSNGDSAHPACRGYLFTVHVGAGQNPIVKVIKTYQPQMKMPNTGGGGNLDIDSDGSYLMNYGFYTGDSSQRERPLFEYHDSGGYTSYATARTMFAFRVHRADGSLPLRPDVQQAGNILRCSDTGAAIKWYRLWGEGLRSIEFVGGGPQLAPAASGYYCATVPYGIGWVVSRPYLYTKK